MAQFWNPAYSCFTFGKVDLVPTVEEYTTLLRCPRVQVNKAYSRAANVSTFVKKLMNIVNLRDMTLAHPDVKKRVNVFTLSIYGLRVTPVPAILAETFRSLSTCRRAGEGRFIRCVQLLLVWFHSHFWKVDKVSYQVFFENYSPLKEVATTPRIDNISEEKWIAILQNLQEQDVEWKAAWMVPDEILYRCGSFDWVPLLGIWGAVGYAPLLVLRQYRSR
ncbi:hypothetical protein J1N35_014259 [Gossypium stocksii]|uniref:DUF7745 domain-containing protein n=1 Tax=Gossypium stocksii TaxID=47602 RepID=A0A9D4A7F7_9ROSI|nr:hypothetical protein J1N35_014259 [Gossypium stocksii]